MHFQLPSARCARLQVFTHLTEDEDLHVDDIAPCSSQAPIREPTSWLVLGWAMACGGALSHAALQLQQASTECAFISATLALCGGVVAGLWTGSEYTARWRASRADNLHRAWRYDMADEDEDEVDDIQRKSKSL